MRQKLAAPLPVLRLRGRRGGPVAPSTGSAVVPPAPRKTASWLDTAAMLIVLAGGVWCVYAHGDLADDVSAKVSAAKQQLTAPIATSPAGSSCGIPDSERDAFNVGWEVGHAAR